MSDTEITKWGSPAKTPLEAELRRRFISIAERYAFQDALYDEKRAAMPAPLPGPYGGTWEDHILSCIKAAEDSLAAIKNADIEEALREDIETRVEERALGLAPSPLTHTIKTLEKAEKHLRYLETEVRSIKAALAEERKRVESLA